MTNPNPTNLTEHDNMSDTHLARDLMDRAICNTDHPARAACALMMAAGEILNTRFGSMQAIDIMRTIIDVTEAGMVERHGQQPGETAQ